MHFWWENYGLDFECRACGRCCGGKPGSVWVTRSERAKIAAELGIDEYVLRKEYLVRRGGKCSVKEKENYDCYFFDGESKKCTIYKVRPLQCRLFPFWPSMLMNKSVWDYYASFCPGMGHGRHYTPEMLKQIIELPEVVEL